MSKLKAAVVRWRGGVRYGGATIVVTGRVEDGIDPGSKAPAVFLRASETSQLFQLRSGAAGSALEALPRGEVLRVTGRVVRGSEGNEHEISLELESVECDRLAHRPR